MNRPIFWWQKLQLRRVFTVALVAVTFLIGVSLLTVGNPLPAQAALTPEAKSYQVDHGNSRISVGSG